MNTSKKMTNDNSFTLRKMTFDDIYQVSAVDQKCFNDPWSTKLIQKELENDFAYYAVVLCQDKIVGFIGVWFVIDDVQIMNVAVDPSYQSLGVGTMMMNHITDLAQQKNMYTMTLEVRVSNEKAIRLYKKYGFEIVYTREKYYSDNNEDAYVMYKYVK